MRSTKSKDPAGNAVAMHYPENMLQLFADGIGEAMFSGTHVKMVLFQSVPPDHSSTDPAVEVRQASAIVAMPIPQLVEAFTTILSKLSENMDQLDLVNRAQREKTLAMLAPFSARK